MFGCSEDFVVTAPYKDITLVYGMLNMNDTAHYIRIQKAFLDEQKSAIDMAKVPDSNYYKESDLNVTVLELTGTAGMAIPVTRVNMEDEGYTKQPGTFFTSPNYAYKFKHPLNPSRKYRLVISNNITGEVDSADISIVDATKLYSPSFNQAQYKIMFARTQPAEITKFPLTFNFGPEVRYVEAVLRFRWVEVKSNGTEIDKSADLKLGSMPVNEHSITGTEYLVYPNISIYSFLRDAMHPAPSNEARYLDSCDVYLYAAGQDFYEYLTVNQIQSGGLTADQIKPLYTNIKGRDVYGLFSSRTFVAKLNVPIDSITYDSLRVNPITAPLNIQGFSDH
jgi:hypothetical protein